MTAAATLLDGRYSLDEQIGAGGFCEVWRATDTVLMRPVAVKLLHASYAHQREARARFQAEARHAGMMSQQNIARVYDYGEPAQGQSYLVMELIEGPCLSAVLAGGPLGAARTMDIVAQVADGLQAAHSAGLVHRDIKPANIMFTPDGMVRITDFGIAHAVGSAPLTVTGMVMGTPGYIAPERVAGASAGPASDLYALGIVAYECLAGMRPFCGPPLEVAIAHRDRPLPPLPARLPAEVVTFVMMLTAKDPAWRPPSASQVACQARRLRDRLVSGATGGQPVPAGPPPAATGPPGSRARAAAAAAMRTGWSRHRRAVGAVSAVLAAFTCLVVLTVTGLASAPRPPVGPFSGVQQAAQPAVKSPSTASPVAAHPGGQQPAGASTTIIGAVAAITHRSAGNPVSQPVPRHKNPSAPGKPAKPGPGKRNGHGKPAGTGGPRLLASQTGRRCGTSSQ